MSKRRLYQIIEIGNRKDFISRSYDYLLVISIIVNLSVMLLGTFEELSSIGSVLMCIDYVTGYIFVADYILRLYTADVKFKRGILLSMLMYVISLQGLVDILTILPIFMGTIVPGGVVAFRLIRVVRTFRLFQITAKSDALNVIVVVLKLRANQLLAAVFFFGVLDIFASLVMYYLEHDAQPDVFVNAFSGVWWSVSTLLTVGYGDIYPITTAGKIVAIFVAMLGVAIVAVPTGIISAGFVEQYKLHKKNGYNDKELLQRVEQLMQCDDDFAAAVRNIVKMAEKK